MLKSIRLPLVIHKKTVRACLRLMFLIKTGEPFLLAHPYHKYFDSKCKQRMNARLLRNRDVLLFLHFYYLSICPAQIDPGNWRCLHIRILPFWENYKPAIKIPIHRILRLHHFGHLNIHHTKKFLLHNALRHQLILPHFVHNCCK